MSQESEGRVQFGSAAAECLFIVFVSMGRRHDSHVVVR